MDLSHIQLAAQYWFSSKTHIQIPSKKTTQPKLHSRHGFLSSAWLTWHYLAVICCNSTPLHSTDATLHSAQLPGLLFSPNVVWKKLSQPILLHFPCYLCSPCKISRGVSVAASAREHFFINQSLLNPFHLPCRKLFFSQASNISSCWL